MMHREGNAVAKFPMSPEHRMLLQIRDTLYEGDWDHFVADLDARMNGRPHVFDLVPPSADARSMMERHLRFIREMRAWELENDAVIRVDDVDPSAPRGC